MGDMSSAPDLFSFEPKGRIVAGGYEIERDIPIAVDHRERKRREWSKPKFPFAELGVGESFTQAPIHGLTLIETQNLVSGAACQYRKKQPAGSWNFTTRQIRGAVRCWRIA